MNIIVAQLVDCGSQNRILVFLTFREDAHKVMLLVCKRKRELMSGLAGTCVQIN